MVSQIILSYLNISELQIGSGASLKPEKIFTFGVYKITAKVKPGTTSCRGVTNTLLIE